jgi:hypothetical protein
MVGSRTTIEGIELVFDFLPACSALFVDCEMLDLTGEEAPQPID